MAKDTMQVKEALDIFMGGYDETRELRVQKYSKHNAHAEDVYQTIYIPKNTILKLSDTPEIKKIFTDNKTSELCSPAREAQNSEPNETLVTDTEGD